MISGVIKWHLLVRQEPSIRRKRTMIHWQQLHKRPHAPQKTALTVSANISIKLEI